MTEPAVSRSRRATFAAAAIATGLALAIALAALYLARRQLAREAVTGWLASKGIASESAFSELGPGRLVGRVRIGPASAPDLTAERVEVRYSLAGLLTGRGVQVSEIRLTRPVLRASIAGGRFTVGALDPLVAEFRKRPPKPGEPHPRIDIEDGRLSLATDFARLDARVSARVENARLSRLDASTAPTRLATPQVAADLGSARLAARTEGDRLAITLRAPFSRATAAGARARDGLVVATFTGPYRDLALGAQGSGTAELQAAAVEAAGVHSGPIRLVLRAPELQGSPSGQASGRLTFSADARGLEAAQLRLAAATADGSATFATGAGPVVRLQARLDGRGGWPGLGAVSPGDSPQIAAVKRGLRAFRVSLDGVTASLEGGRTRAQLTGAARLLPDGGGEVRLAPRGAGYRLTSAGGGLPRLDADVRRVAITDGRFSAEGAVTAGLSIGPVADAAIDAAGVLDVAQGEARFAASRCASVKAARVELGRNAIERLSARLCPTGEPMIRVGRGRWAFSTRAEDAALSAPFLQAQLEHAEGQLGVSRQRGLSARLTLAAAQVRDTAREPRFEPTAASGQLTLADQVWRGTFAARAAKGAPLAHGVLRHDGRAGAGELQIETGQIRFAPGALQPADLSRLAEPLGTAVAGAAAFTGAVRWTPAGTTSDGRLTTSGLDFKTPLGQVSGLAGDIRFSSLAPLTAPPGQTLRIKRIDAALPITDASVRFALDEHALIATGGQASAGGGRLLVERLEVPLAAGQAVQGALQVEGVQVHDLVEASPFGDRVDLDARVSGRIPFFLQGQKLRIAGGDLHAIAPGRLSITRAALTSVQAQGSLQAPPAAGPAASTDTFTDFAYQAMENLAFDKLDAGVDSRADGRLGVLLHIVGRHDPPQHQEITLSWLDVIRRRFLGKKLPLPSDTGVDLTLDTTLNLDDLLQQYADYQRLRSSPPVQR